MSNEQLDMFGGATASAASPVVVAAGLGVDSTAALVEMERRAIRPDRILFADTGGEKPETMAYLGVLNERLAAVGFPEIVTVRYKVQRPLYGHYETLEEECLLHGKLPAISYGGHQCSDKWKIGPQRRDLENWEPARRAWAQGVPVTWVIGFDAGPKDARRCERLPDDDPRYRYWTPLIEWGWDRERCKLEIGRCDRLSAIAARHGVDPVPVKSACFFCGSSKASEVVELKRLHPDLADRAMRMERQAAPNLTTTTGLFRRATKDRPGSWTELLTGKPLAIAGVGGAAEITERRVRRRAAALADDRQAALPLADGSG